MGDLLELAARVEALTGPDCEVDAAIYYDILGWCRHENKVRSGAQSDTGFDCVDCGADSWGNKSARGQRLHDALPSYTTSLDAAMTLIEEKPFDIVREAISRLACDFALHVTFWPVDENAKEWLARYITAAALRTRTQSSTQQESEL